MTPVYLDLHIHTSENPNNLNGDYDIDLLLSKITQVSKGSDFLISFTDHNTINKSTYLKGKSKIKNLLLGTELHVRNYKDADPYHCHIYFDLKEITNEIIDDLNSKLDVLYPQKIVSKEDNIPALETIINTFDLYEFILLPHGGQSHSTFDGSIPKGIIFDNTLERSIYYNQFDGFTARSDKGLEITQEYFKKLGINEFVNLVTCTDNYNPKKYPESKSKEASPFVPTWMFALPTFEGLRLSLSESSRLVYSDEKPDIWSEYIENVSLKNNYIDLEVNLTPGLNVVIGGSSSGKTLFVDSVYRKIINDFNESEYVKANLGVEEITVKNPSGTHPHYISQNYIIRVIDNNDTDNTIDDIEIIKNVFPGDETIKDKVNQGLLNLRNDLKELITSVKRIEEIQNQFKHIPLLSSLISTEKVKENILKYILPSPDTINTINYKQVDYENHILILNEIQTILNKNPLFEHNPQLIDELIKEINEAYKYSNIEKDIRKIIKTEKDSLDKTLREDDIEQQSKKQDYDKLIVLIGSYTVSLNIFNNILKKISKYSIKCESQEVISMGHKLNIENNFELNKNKVLEVINHFLRNENKIDEFKNIEPESIFESKFKKQQPKVKDYEDFENKVNSKFEELNRKSYKIITNDGRNFENLSAGWKTSVILDLILGYEGDMAPLIIDQPEDNLAIKYINEGLIKAIKYIKSKKQIILVSHNATIPMLGDAQNIVLCRNEDGKIKIRSNRLEGKIDDRSLVDYIAEITDGGKSSIKKRVKKYNLKKFKD